jgi:hypothetical protein
MDEDVDFVELEREGWSALTTDGGADYYRAHPTPELIEHFADQMALLGRLIGLETDHQQSQR